MQPKEIVAQFVENIRAQRLDEAKDLLAYQFGMFAIQKDLVLRQLSADGEHVFAVLDYRTYFEPIGDVRLAIWFRVREEKIQCVETFYNAAVIENMLGGSLPAAE